MKRSFLKRKTPLRAKSKSPRSVQIRISDLVWGTVICVRDKICRYCGKNWATHPHHVFARDKCRTTRYSTSIGIGLCGGCHKFKAHNDPENYRHIDIEELDGRGGHERWKQFAQIRGNTPDPVIAEMALWEELKEFKIYKPEDWHEWSEWKKEKHLRAVRREHRNV